MERCSPLLRPPRVARARWWRALLACALLTRCGPGLNLDQLPDEPPLQPLSLAELLACAGPDQALTRGLPASLDGRCSRQLGSAELRSRLWRQNAGERVTLDSAVEEQVRLIAPARADTLEFGVELRGDRLLSTDSSHLHVVDGPPLSAPVALASGDLLTVDGTATLDASPSTGVDAAIQAVRWRQLVGEPAFLSAPSELRSDVTLAPAAQAAVFALEVQDRNGLWSEPEFVVVQRAATASTPAAPPQLAAAPYVDPGTVVVLTPGLTWPADPGWQALRQLRGDPVAITTLEDGSVQLQAPRRPQRLVFRLDQELAGRRLAPAVAVVQVTAGIANRAPVADAGPDRAVRPEHGVALNGSRSRDPDGSTPLEYRWWQVQGVPVQLSCHDAVCTFEAPHSADDLAFALVVSDGTAESAADVVVIAVDPLAENQPPVASAGGERWALPGVEVELDGRASDDPDSGRIASFRWEQLPPWQIEVTLLQSGDGTVRFVAPATPTTLHFRLTACDVEQACSADDAAVHVESAGPYVDPARGPEAGDGTAERPCRTLGEALLIAERFGLSELRLVAGDHVAAQPVVLPPELVLGGGWTWDGADYVLEPLARSVLSVAGVDAVTLHSGASLQHLEVLPFASSAVVERRRLIVMGPRSALRGVDLTGPELTDESVTVDVGDGHRVEIVDSTVRGGAGLRRSVALQAGPASDLLLRDSQVVLGHAPQLVGIASADGKLSLQRVSLRADAQPSSVGEVTGVDVVRSELIVEASELTLEAGAWSDLALAVTLRCHKCQPSLLSQSQVRGPRHVRAGGRGVAVSLFLARDARIQGTLVGGGASPGAELVALEATGGNLTLQDADLQACSDGQAAGAVALALDAVVVTAVDVELRATAVERALAAQLVGLPAPQLSLRDVRAAAAVAWGIADGWQADQTSPADGSSELELAVSGTLEVTGAVEARGLVLRGSHDAGVQVSELQVAAPEASRGVVLEDSVAVELWLRSARVEADAAVGVGQGVTCQGLATSPADLRLSRSVLQVQGAQATGLEADGCSARLIAAVVEATGQVEAQAVRSNARLNINSCSLRADGAHGATVALETGASGELRNTILAIAPDAVGLDVSDGVDQWLALHHVLFVHSERPLLSVQGAVQAADAEALIALRSRFNNLRSVEDAAIDGSGHLTSALSPAVDAADPATVSLEDIDGEARPLGAGPDIGPDEAF